MDPLTWMAVAQAAVAGVSTVWNFFAGQSQLAQANQRLGQQRTLVDQAHQITMTDINQQDQVARQGVDQAASRAEAGSAQAGALGPDVTDRVVAGADQAENQVDMQYASRTAMADNQYAQQTMQLNDTAQNIREKGQQLNMDTLTGAIGVGLSAAGALAKGGLFDGKKALTPGTVNPADGSIVGQPSLSSLNRSYDGGYMSSFTAPSGPQLPWEQSGGVTLTNAGPNIRGDYSQTGFDQTFASSKLLGPPDYLSFMPRSPRNRNYF